MNVKSYITALLTPVILMLFTGCMSKYEYMLRRQDMEAKAKHPAFGKIVIRGPLNIDKDGLLEIPYPNQPYSHTAIPDGQAIQASVINSTLKTAAVVTGFMYGVHNAKGNTTINNNSPALTTPAGGN